MPKQHRLHLRRIHILAAAHNQIRSALHHKQVAGVIKVAKVSR